MKKALYRNAEILAIIVFEQFFIKNFLIRRRHFTKSHNKSHIKEKEYKNMVSKESFYNISMNGRMAYAILCIEKYISNLYPDKDRSPLSKKMWKVTSESWDEWIDTFIEVIPQYLFEFDSYEESDFENLTKDEYELFVELFSGVSDGEYMDCSDKVGYIINSLKLIEEVYAYSAVPGVGEESIDIILSICAVLESDSVEVPPVELVEFSSFEEQNGWGNQFGGEDLSLIL